jgi:N-acyl-D-aspartate/D-glutamate deacylase
MPDVVIRGGTLIDGSGAPGRTADVAIDGDRVVEVGQVSSRGDREIDADGLLVTPGLVDIHTHYDGQALWDTLLSPSCWQGVTTVVMGNCGVGFAPAAPEHHEFLINLMEGVEDIPGAVLAEGLGWDWESFPEYLDAIERKPHAIDIGAQLPHGALRTYVMGESGADHTVRASEAEIARMGELACEAMLAGAIGFSTSRTVNHRSRDGGHTPSLTASAEELEGIARGIRAAGKGVLQGISDFFEFESEFDVFRRMAATAGRPMSLTVLQNPAAPDQWRDLMEQITKATEDGIAMAGQVATRAVGVMLGLDASLHPFSTCPTYESLASLPLAQRVARMRDPQVKERIVAELDSADPSAAMFANFADLYALGDPPEYEPSPDSSIGARAERDRVAPAALAYDLLLERDGRALLYRPVMNYVTGNHDVTREMLLHPRTLPGLGDGGAHLGLICDVSFPTYLLSHWGRERTRGERMPIEWLVKRQSRDTAVWVGLEDRGLLAPGMKADVNVIDFDVLGPREPEIAHDLPTGARRLIQRASGYRQTLVSGRVVMEEGEHTGELPGSLVRGAQEARA